jgi:hypothetical protein
MSTNETAARAGQDQGFVTAAEWFADGRRIPYDPESARVLTEEEAATAPGVLRVFERVVAATPDTDAVWLTLLPGFPDGSYGCDLDGAVALYVGGSDEAPTSTGRFRPRASACPGPRS